MQLPHRTACWPSPTRYRMPRSSSSLVVLAAVLLTLSPHHSRLLTVQAAMDVRPRLEARAEYSHRLSERQESPTDVCSRWGAQTALVNGTIYVYGGHATERAGQEEGTWNNNFITLDVTRGWDIASPALSGLPQPSGPPAVALGYLWHSYSSLFLYGGQYSDSPVESPRPFSLWEYDISGSRWIEHESPRTSAGTNAADGGQDVQQAAEGAGVTVPSLGRGYYFGGHIDGYTTAGWSQSIPRIYLRSFIEFTFPGFSNTDVEPLADGGTAGPDGEWRNITEAGLQGTSGFPERADGVLVYVPGYGEEGIILSIAGGTSTTFSQMNIIDVFDIAQSTWFRQSTRGGLPNTRVNPCVVAASAADGSSTNIYMFGGQDLPSEDQNQFNGDPDQPRENQTQYSDTWILSVPSFTWIEVPSNESVPYARAGHSCEVWDGQMIVIGGYTGPQLSCESPGVYVFDMSTLEWRTSFTALEGSNDQSQQLSQDQNLVGLAGSYGYQVPQIVRDVIGGDGNGGATVTAPAASATGGPFQTGSPLSYTVTATGATTTSTSEAGGAGGAGGNGDGPNVGAIVAGVIAGVFFLLACYLGFCAYVYRKQLQLYKNHVAAAQRGAISAPNEKTGFLFGDQSSDRPSSNNPNSIVASNGNPSSSQARVEAAAPPRQSLSGSSTEDFFLSHEPSFFGVMLSPRKSLRVINRD